MSTLNPAEERDAWVEEARSRGLCRFCGVEIEVAEGVIVPRAETELLAERAITILKERERAESRLHAIDMCCGAGNLASVLAVRSSVTRVVASDLTPACANLARKNVKRLGIEERVTVVCGDLFAEVPQELKGQIDIIVCNPPYISTGRLASESAFLLEKEPREAFDGGPYGLTIHQRVLRESPEWLRKGGWLLFEFGLGQERQLKILLERAKVFENIEFIANSAGEPRVSVASVKG